MFTRSTLVALLAFGACDASSRSTATADSSVASPTDSPTAPDDRGSHSEADVDSFADEVVHASTVNGQAGLSAHSLHASARAGHGAAAITTIVPATNQARLEYEQNTIDVFRAVAPATVFVTQNQLVRDRWSRRALEVPTGSGSGFVWDRAGHIVTNAHVIASSRRGTTYSITLYDGESYEATLVGRDDHKDIAVLKVKVSANKLSPIRLPDPTASPEVGQKALAIGNPFGLDHTLTVGVVSALGREVQGFGDVTIRGMIQTDASINPGNSGGPLLDASGELLGMNTIIYSKSGSSAGIGFAVPVDIIRRVVPQLIKYGEPLRTGLGVTLISDDIARANGIRGVVIQRVSKSSGAGRAGLQGLRVVRGRYVPTDVIVGIDDKKIEDFDDLYTVLDEHAPGDKVKVHVIRDNSKRMTFTVELMRLTGAGE